VRLVVAELLQILHLLHLTPDDAESSTEETRPVGERRHLYTNLGLVRALRCIISGRCTRYGLTACNMNPEFGHLRSVPNKVADVRCVTPLEVASPTRRRAKGDGGVGRGERSSDEPSDVTERLGGVEKEDGRGCGGRCGRPTCGELTGEVT
jgi:hypothetical protein